MVFQINKIYILSKPHRNIVIMIYNSCAIINTFSPLLYPIYCVGFLFIEMIYNISDRGSHKGFHDFLRLWKHVEKHPHFSGVI